MGRHKKVGRKTLPNNGAEKNRQEWRKKNNKLINIRLNVDSDKDIIDYLSKIDNKTELFRALIREHMSRCK